MILYLKTLLLVKWRTFGFVEPISLHLNIVINLNVKAELSNVLSCAYLTYPFKRNIN